MSVPAGRIDTVTTTAAHRQRGFLLSLLTLLTLVGAIGFGTAIDASASTRPATETRVRAFDTPASDLVGRVDPGSSTAVRVSGDHLRQLVSATGVAIKKGWEPVEYNAASDDWADFFTAAKQAGGGRLSDEETDNLRHLWGTAEQVATDDGVILAQFRYHVTAPDKEDSSSSKSGTSTAGLLSTHRAPM